MPKVHGNLISKQRKKLPTKSDPLTSSKQAQRSGLALDSGSRPHLSCMHVQVNSSSVPSTNCIITVDLQIIWFTSI